MDCNLHPRHLMNRVMRQLLILAPTVCPTVQMEHASLTVMMMLTVKLITMKMTEEVMPHALLDSMTLIALSRDHL